MKFKLTPDKKFLQLIDSTKLEFDQLQYSFTKHIDNWFIIKKKIPNWDGIVKFIDNIGRIPLGLWGEVKNLGKKYNFVIEIEGSEEIINQKFNPEDFDNWMIDYFKESDITPYSYQIEAAKRALKFKYCTEEISTSGGKTLIAYMIFKYLFDKKEIKKFLYVVPNISLIEQSEDKFLEYEERCKKKPNWKSVCIYGGSKRRNEESADVVFGTFQSLAKKDLEYFSKFDAVCIDETHHARANSIKTILVKCYNAKYKFGLTGTLPKEGSCDSFTVQAYLGPRVYQIHSIDIINEGQATPIHVIGIELNYLTEKTKKELYELRDVKTDEKDGVKLLNLERDIVREDRKRLLYICETISKTKKNSLVLFSDVKNEYGRNIFNWLKENTDKKLYYVDGGTSAEHREYYKKKMEEENNVVLVASTGTFSEGIDILNLHNIFITETSKSDYLVRQILGRGMRLMEGKEKVLVFDFRDNFIYLGTNKYQQKNYLMRHAEERERIYKEKRFPFKKFKVKL